MVREVAIFKPKNKTLNPNNDARRCRRDKSSKRASRLSFTSDRSIQKWLQS